ncbi:MAG TPA: GTP 3',8-cyclase MoaA [Anaerolineaceae bacterium]|nr:GTP 3',8-cyclase MoaA [Longilinea sp.]HNY99924.1 GTP 3',8-cyclase MoaA [Anaerolineaceae bacterium]HOD44054.1 GTP 3',8-cyclase MoaA [Anaerolineaceae bacterium]HQL39587.1 GTP 3',8-cyclase MoaA [Anaerolineaceae bacterium]HQP61550.1 GTP 3',8-cyclase MoaA [Anaerolineaceae bacterium]
MFIDRYGRKITYLRISVTDRCNIRCVYCMPAEGILQSTHQAILRYEEIALIVRLAAEHGITEVRLTGGEPLVRADLPDLIRMIAGTPGIEDVSLTTNGLLLGKMAKELAEAGLRRVNVSLDTLNPERFARITRGGSLQKVLDGLDLAEVWGLLPIKINMVVMRGVNDDEMESMAQLSVTRGWHVRFIEIMPIQNQTPWGEGFPMPADTYYPIPEMIERLKEAGLQKVDDKVGSGPAVEYCLPGALGRIGFITPVSEPFCSQCNRLRLTADGNLRPCLMSDIEVPILQTLREGGDILPLFEQAVLLKPEAHELQDQHAPAGRCMRQIGG